MTVEGHPESSQSYTIRHSSVRRFVLSVVSLIVLVGVVFLAVVAARSLTPSDSLGGAVNTSEYQAVFLSNGQVYFGNLSSPGGDFYYLKHIYYLESQVSPQSGKAPRQQLIKLGSEIHGPEDEMIINRQHILFVENLKPGGKVSQAIRGAQGH